VPARPRYRLLVALVRALLLAVLIALLAFAASLFLAIVGVALVAIVRGGGVDMALAYRHVAAPFALAVFCVSLAYLLVSAVREVRQGRAAPLPAKSRAA
jgi:hypothetical protein